MKREERAARDESLKVEVREYAERIVADAPPLSENQLRVVVGALRPTTALSGVGKDPTQAGRSVLEVGGGILDVVISGEPDPGKGDAPGLLNVLLQEVSERVVNVGVHISVVKESERRVGREPDNGMNVLSVVVGAATPEEQALALNELTKDYVLKRSKCCIVEIHDNVSATKAVAESGHDSFSSGIAPAGASDGASQPTEGEGRKGPRNGRTLRDDVDALMAEVGLSLHGDVNPGPLAGSREHLDGDGVGDGQTADGVELLAEGPLGGILPGRDSVDLGVQPFVNFHDSSPSVGTGVGASQPTEGEHAGITCSGAPSTTPEPQERNPNDRNGD